jgi:hypothetical protein
MSVTKNKHRESTEYGIEANLGHMSGSCDSDTRTANHAPKSVWTAMTQAVRILFDK